MGRRGARAAIMYAKRGAEGTRKALCVAKRGSQQGRLLISIASHLHVLTIQSGSHIVEFAQHGVLEDVNYDLHTAVQSAGFDWQGIPQT